MIVRFRPIGRKRTIVKFQKQTDGEKSSKIIVVPVFKPGDPICKATCSNPIGDAYEEEVVAVNSSDTGGGGNPYYSSLLEQTENTSYHSTYQRTKATVVEEEVVAVNSVGTGGGGNPHYMSRFENEASDSSDDVEEDEVVAISSAPTGGKGNPYYAKELMKEDSEMKKKTQFTGKLRDVLLIRINCL